MAEVRKAIGLDPHDAWARILLGSALSGQGKTEEAIAEFRTATAEVRNAIELDPHDEGAHVDLGQADN
jgi:Flp pilus assembly protein TadD